VLTVPEGFPGKEEKLKYESDFSYEIIQLNYYILSSSYGTFLVVNLFSLLFVYLYHEGFIG
jgi:hypothetical protein